MAVVEKDVASARMPHKFAEKGEPLAGAFFWLSAFYVVYCARPEDWIPGLKYIPLAKISGLFALLGLLTSAGKTKRGLSDLPREAKYFFAIVGLLFLAAVLSPVWRGGALIRTIDFAKAPVAWVLTFLLITTFARLRRIIFIQSFSVALVAIVSVIKGRSVARLEGVIGGIYANPNDLAFAIVLTLPFCFAFLLTSRTLLQKLAWAGAMLVMCTSLFMTASRAGFVDFLVTGAVCLWIFGIKGKRIHLVVATAVMAVVIGVAAGGKLKERFMAISGNIQTDLDESAYGSYEQRRFLMVRSLEAIEHYPWGVGLGNFTVYSGTWREVHVAYLQMAAEGGIAALVLYLMFFARGFDNLRKIRRMPVHDPEIDLFAGALFATLIGFVVGALFAPEAYQLFPYFAVAYTSVLYVIAKARQESGVPPPDLPNRSQRRLRSQGGSRVLEPVGNRESSGALTTPLRNQR